MTAPGFNPRPPWRGARVVLGVTGGIAAYKAVQLARDLTRSGAEVDVIMTSGGLRFVQPLTFEAVTGRPVHTDLWASPTEGGAARHIELGRNADAVCVAPATANFLARAAQGRADDLLTATLLVTRAPVLLCPAMNDLMYTHPQVQRNLAHLRDELSYRLVGPGVGPLAHGEDEGPGRMIEPDRILEHVGRALGADDAFRDRTVLITAGPTREPLDAVRYVGNRSSGRMGFALARAAWRRGARVILVTGPVRLDDPEGAEVERVETARDMEAAVRRHLPGSDVSIFAAAVSDYRPSEPVAGKLKRSREGKRLTLELEVNPDVALDTRQLRRKKSVAVGFALETADLVENALSKLTAKGFDLIVANAVADDSGFESDTNRVTLVGPGGDREALPLLSKDAVAERILDRVAERLRAGAQ
ncbi:MAG TPA: bifunctional phosphopantothenoylcysteine decarboxylase/phosphopantothenate--cysteine ligase CoaBC [Longimicrobiales bacterium]